MSGGGGSNVIPETPLQKTQAMVAAQQWSDYNKRWAPVQEFFINRTKGGQGAKQLFLEGKNNADVEGQFGNAEAGLNAALARKGALPGSGASIFAATKLAGDAGTSLGMGKVNVDDAVTRQYMGGLQDIVAMGRGQRATSNQALADVASLSGQVAAANAEAAQQDAAGLGEAIGTGVSMAGTYGLMGAMNRAKKGPPTGLSKFNSPDDWPTSDYNPLGGVW